MDQRSELESVLQQFHITDPRELRRALVVAQTGLSHADVNLLELLARKYTNEQIAERLDLQERKSAQERINKLLDRLGLCDRHSLMVFAVWAGLGPAITIDPATGRVKVNYK